VKRLARAFWNPDQRRLRALWRLLLQLALILLAWWLLGTIARQLPQTPTVELIVPLLPPLVAMLVVWLASALLDRRRVVDLGLRLDRSWWADFAFGLVLGAGLMTAVFAVAGTAGWITFGTAPVLTVAIRPAALAVALMFVDSAVLASGEELVFRGYQMRNLAEGLNLRALGPRAALMLGLVLTSVFFAALHLPDPNAATLSTLNSFLGGLLFGVAFACTGRLGLPIGLHLAWNFTQGSVFGFPVSGNAPRAALLNIDELGHDLWTGGAYGPEGGLLGTAALAAAIPLTLGWIRLYSGSLGLKIPLAQYHRL